MRRKEIAEIRWKDVIVQEGGMMKIHVRNGKNGPRTVYIYESVPLVDKWLDEYPDPSPDDSLWIDTRSHMPNREVNARALSDIVSKARENSCISDRRKTNLHAWRKARASDMAAKGMNQPAMEDYFGWCRGSRMPRIYIELAEVDLENQVRDIYGLDRKRKQQKFIGENLEEYQGRKTSTRKVTA
jgi:integrase